MREDYYAYYYDFENNNWWFVSRRKIIRALLNKYLPDNQWNILDVGCGTGINLSLLAEYGNVVGIDSSEEAIRFCHMRDEGNIRVARVEDLPFHEGEFNFVTALDVLEHIENDEQGLCEIARVCEPGGMFLLTVPVFPSLWGEHDEINQHVRRYEPRRLLSLLQNNGFEIVHRSFMNTWLLPGVFIWRWWLKIRRWFFQPPDGLARPDNMHHHPFMNRVLTAIFSSELPIVVHSGLPVGLSLVVLARKGG